ncbi:hypothetical protein CSW34_09345 [Thermus scotoductus]|nr:hypothetical protein CSW34_09345 [Thermus scotoductus]
MPEGFPQELEEAFQKRLARLAPRGPLVLAGSGGGDSVSPGLVDTSAAADELLCVPLGGRRLIYNTPCHVTQTKATDYSLSHSMNHISIIIITS